MTGQGVWITHLGHDLGCKSWELWLSSSCPAIHGSCPVLGRGVGRLGVSTEEQCYPQCGLYHYWKHHYWELAGNALKELYLANPNRKGRGSGIFITSSLNA